MANAQSAMSLATLARTAPKWLKCSLLKKHATTSATRNTVKARLDYPPVHLMFFHCLVMLLMMRNYCFKRMQQ
jgi:hypothetical protein